MACAPLTHGLVSSNKGYSRTYISQCHQLLNIFFFPEIRRKLRTFASIIEL